MHQRPSFYTTFPPTSNQRCVMRAGGRISCLAVYIVHLPGIERFELRVLPLASQRDAHTIFAFGAYPESDALSPVDKHLFGLRRTFSSTICDPFGSISAASSMALRLTSSRTIC